MINNQPSRPIHVLNVHAGVDGTHEALYLSDPDGNGLELAWDRPQSEWPRNADGTLSFAHGQRDLNATVEELLAVGRLGVESG